MKPGDVLPAVERLITQERIQRYAEASGDFNPIHIDPDFAATSQFGRTVAHGMMIAATISEAMTVAFKRHWLEDGRLKLRFKAPVYPGDTVTSFGTVKSVHEESGNTRLVCAVEARTESGELAVTGEATVLIPGSTGLAMTEEA
jgi:3-hydroxybutyryl-CoA dehydratase